MIIMKRQRIMPFTKALGMIVLIAWVLFNVDFQMPFLAVLLLVGLAFGLAGDILLALGDKWFTAGLGAFLLGHIVYLTLFASILIRSNRLGLLTSVPAWLLMILVTAVVGALVTFSRVIVRPLRRQNPDRGFLIALIIYAMCLTAVMISGWLTAIVIPGVGWKIWALPLGGTLFFTSDFILAYDRFIRKVRGGQLWVMITYYLAQFLLAFGFVATTLLFV
ncbi:lysoplasmalogenase [bacterium]|nr:lysoplasmalogenase [bacterium]